MMIMRPRVSQGAWTAPPTCPWSDTNNASRSVNQWRKIWSASSMSLSLTMESSSPSISRTLLSKKTIRTTSTSITRRRKCLSPQRWAVSQRINSNTRATSATRRSSIRPCIRGHSKGSSKTPKVARHWRSLGPLGSCPQHRDLKRMGSRGSKR